MTLTPAPLQSLWNRWETRPWFPTALFALVTALVLLPGTSSIPLMDRDEPRFAQATWEMMEREDWLIPYFNDQYRFDKPVLSYWWMRIHYWVLGKSEIGARLHSVLASFLVALLIHQFGIRFFTARAGLLAGLAWLTCVQVLIHGRLCVADMPMLLGVTASMLGLMVLLTEKEQPKRFGPWFWLLLGGMVFGFLAKGPIANLTPVFAAILARFLFYRKPLPWHHLQPIALSLLFLLGIGLWGIPALWETRGLFWDKGMGEHVIQRGTEAFNGRVTIPVLFYLVTGPISLLPWSAFLPEAFRNEKGWRNWSSSNGLLMGWFVGPFLLFAFYATQLPHYILPGFPAFFLLLFRRETLSLQGYPKWFWTTTLLIVSLSFIFLCSVLASPLEGDLLPIKHLLLIGAVLFILTAGFCLILRFRAWAVFPIASVLTAILISSFGNTLRGLSPMPDIQQAWSHHAPGSHRYNAWVFEEPSLIFYMGKTWSFEKDIPTLTSWLLEKEQPSAGVFLLREWRLDDQFDSLFQGKGFTNVPDQDHRASLENLRNHPDLDPKIIRGLNIARSSWVELLVVESPPIRSSNSKSPGSNQPPTQAK
ncbi:MAG: glycosyltransferase family 39 protein [Verrucomicrobiota bacterium]